MKPLPSRRLCGAGRAAIVFWVGTACVAVFLGIDAMKARGAEVPVGMLLMLAGIVTLARAPFVGVALRGEVVVENGWWWRRSIQLRDIKELTADSYEGGLTLGRRSFLMSAVSAVLIDGDRFAFNVTVDSRAASVRRKEQMTARLFAA